MTKVWRWLLPAVVLAAGVAGGWRAQAATVPPRVLLYPVEAFDYGFRPAEIRVPRGAEVTVRLTNRGKQRHEWEVEALGVEVKPVAPGQTGQVTFRAEHAGRYEFICDLDDHAARGMRGTLIVE